MTSPCHRCLRMRAPIDHWHAKLSFGVESVRISAGSCDCAPKRDHPGMGYRMGHFLNEKTYFFARTSLMVLAIIVCLPVAEALDCFKCVSTDGDNPACDDPFHNNYTFDILESPCMGGRKGRNGLFPATSCLKLSGVYIDDDENERTMVVRGCGLDSGTLNVDTEIVRMSHCGGFYYNSVYVRGCVQSCTVDACNLALVPKYPTTLMLASMAVLTSTLHIFTHSSLE